MFEAIGEQLQKRIFHTRNRKLRSKIDLKDTFNTPLLLRINDQRMINKRLSEVRFISRNQSSVPETFDSENIVVVAKKATRYNMQARFSHGFQANPIKKQQAKPQQNRQMIQINGLVIEPLRYRSLLTARHAPSNSRCSMIEDNNSTKMQTFLITSINNNEDLIRKILLTRKDWKQVKRGDGVPTLKWLAGDYGHGLFTKLDNSRNKRILNQFEGHHEITTKNGLIRNLQFYTETKKIELFSITPVTFLLDFEEQFCQYNLKQFLSFFVKNSPKLSQLSRQAVSKRIYSFVEKFGCYMSTRNSQLKKRINPLSKPIISQSYFQGQNYIWLLKPTGLNRGRGIQIFNSLEQLEKILIGYLQIAGKKRMAESALSYTSRKQKKQMQKTSDKTADRDEVFSDSEDLKKSPAQGFVLRDCSFVIQKYIERPLLIAGRKFDIRVWALLDYEMNLYFFKEGYLRMSSQQYSTKDINNYFIHLTNNAVQKYSKQYGLFENGNQISFPSFKKILTEQGAEQKFTEIVERIKQYSYITLSSARTKMNPHQHRYCFQIFGFDYILDDLYKVWLIEVNNNPCIECSSPILGQYIPRMLDDAFKIVLDPLYKSQDSQRQEFPVDGYHNRINMWQRLGKLAPNSNYKAKQG